MKSRDEFRDGVSMFMEKYIKNGRRIDTELLKELKVLSDFAKSTEIYKTQKAKENFYDFSYDDVFNHMCIKIIGAPEIAVYVALLCIPFIYDKWIQERGA